MLLSLLLLLLMLSASLSFSLYSLMLQKNLPYKHTHCSSV
jgi:hypothetical protein